MKQIPILIPTFGILVFIGLYIYAASLYPGGSQANPYDIGWNWYNNLWCHLMSEHAINGLENPASVIARFAMAVLSSSIAIFYFLCAKFLVKNRVWSVIIKITGVLLVISAIFIFSRYHDILTTIISICGFIGIAGILRALYLNKMTFFVVFGLVCLLVIGMNNLFYYIERLNEYLPLVQNFDFALIFLWTVGLNIKMLNKQDKA